MPKPPTGNAADPIFQRAVQCHQQGQLDQAESLYRAVLAQQPRHVHALQNLGVIANQRSQWEIALPLLEEAVRLAPGDAGGYCNLGITLHQLGRQDEALERFTRAATLNPCHGEAHFNRALVLLARGQHAAALASLDQVLKLNPRHAGALQRRGDALRELQHLDEAAAAYAQALAVHPGDSPLHYHRGLVLLDLQRTAEALAHFDRALELEPGLPEALLNRGTALERLGQLSEAVTSYRLAQLARPGYVEAEWNEGLAQLLLGNFRSGWRGYEKRRETNLIRLAPRRQDFLKPAWQGEPLPVGQTLLLHAEQGLGDTLQFCRYAPLLAERGAEIVLEVQPSVRRLMELLPGVGQVLAMGEALPQFDLHCPLLSLPLAFGTDRDSIPARVPYLYANPARVAHWGQRLGIRTSPRVGLVWSGSTGHRNDVNRSIPLEGLAPLLSQAGIEFISLQVDVRPADQPTLARYAPIRTFAAELTDFAETAALMMQLDLVITVDTAAAHLAGALDRPVWILLPFVPDWRWLLDRPDSPWYPSARLFRQPAIGDWRAVIRQVADALGAFVVASP